MIQNDRMSCHVSPPSLRPPPSPLVFHPIIERHRSIVVVGCRRVPKNEKEFATLAARRGQFVSFLFLPPSVSLSLPLLRKLAADPAVPKHPRRFSRGNNELGRGIVETLIVRGGSRGKPKRIDLRRDSGDAG